MLRQPNGETWIGVVPANNKDKLKRTKEGAKSKFFDSKVEIKTFNKFEKLCQETQDGEIEELSGEDSNVLEDQQYKKKKHKGQNLSRSMPSVSATVDKDDELNDIIDGLEQYNNEKSQVNPCKKRLRREKGGETIVNERFAHVFLFLLRLHMCKHQTGMK